MYKLRPVVWTTDHLAYTDHYTADVMGVTLSVIPDDDGTFTASMTTGIDTRPELQKGFESASEAREYAVNVMLQRVINRDFTSVAHLNVVEAVSRLLDHLVSEFKDNENLIHIENSIRFNQSDLKIGISISIQ